MRATRVKAAVLSALVGHYELRRIVDRRFLMTKSREDKVACSDVDKAVADELHVDVSPTLRARVRIAAALCGFSWITRPQHKPHFRFMRAR